MWNLSRPTQYYLSQLGISEDSHSAERALDRISTSVAQQSLQGVSDNLRDSFLSLIFFLIAQITKISNKQSEAGYSVTLECQY